MPRIEGLPPRVGREVLPLLVALAAQGGFPEGFLETAAFLRAHGLGDPRGGTYRAAKLPVVPGAPTEVHGWAFADGRFVSREGLTFVGVRPTGPADLEADVAKPSREDGWIVAATLLAAERPDLARRLLAGEPAEAYGKKLDALYGFLVRWHAQAVVAHGRGDDREAARIERGLLAEAPAYPKEAPSEGWEWGFLPDLDVLARDTARRLNRRKARVKDEARRLIDGLEDVVVVQNSLPGRAQFVESPAVRRLVALGDRAVDPLLDCIESDRRLTRTFSFGQQSTIWVETVETAARTALFGILGIDVFSDAPVTKLRAYWAAHRHESPARRAYGLLADDAQAPGIWVESAERLFGVRRLPNLYDAPVPVGQGLRPPAEELRDPALLIRRARAFEAGLPGYPKEYGLHRAARFAAMLTLLDREAGLGLLRDATRAAGARLLVDPGSSTSGEVVGSGFAFRADHGDKEAWTDYRAWLAQRRERGAARVYSSRPFDPLVARRKELRGAAEAFFGPGSPWRPLAMLKAGLEPGWLYVSPLLGLPAVREGVVEALDDRTPGKSLDVGPDTGRAWRCKGRDWALAPRPKDAPPPGTTIRLRLADELADRLADLDGAPAFHLWWPEPRRDEGLRAMARHVRARGDRLYRRRPWWRARA